MTINEGIAQYIPTKFRSLYYNNKTDEIYLPGSDNVKRYLTAKPDGAFMRFECKDREGKAYGSALKYYDSAAKIIISLNNFKLIETPDNLSLNKALKEKNARNNNYLDTHYDNRKQLAELNGVPFVCSANNQSLIRIFDDPNIYLLRDGQIRIIDENSEDFQGDLAKSYVFSSFEEIFSSNLPLPRVKSTTVGVFTL